MITVYAVVFGNYFPRELDSLWKTKEMADTRADSLDGDWRVVEMTVFESESDCQELSG